MLLADRYRVERTIGTGGFGVVEKCFDTVTGSHVAIKTVSSRHVNSESARLLREIDIMLQLSNQHPRVMSLYDVFVTPTHDSNPDATAFGPTSGASTAPDTAPQATPALAVTAESDFNVHLVMPLMKGDLHAYAKNPLPDVPNKDEAQRIIAVVFAFHLIFGLDYIHKCGLVHRDIKPENILVSLDLGQYDASCAVIADFGLARDAATTETFYVCTRHYRPPEVVTNSCLPEHMTGIDIWSVGCILFELCTRTFLVRLPTALNDRQQWVPLQASQQLEVILNAVGTPAAEDVQTCMAHGQFANVRSYLLKSQPRASKVAAMMRHHWKLTAAPREEQALWIDLVTSCLSFFPQQRPTAEQLCRHPLFQRFGVHFGDNVLQYPPRPYEPVAVSRDRLSNKARILQMTRDVQLAALQQQAEGGATAAAPVVAEEKVGAAGDASGGPLPVPAPEGESPAPPHGIHGDEGAVLPARGGAAPSTATAAAPPPLSAGTPHHIRFPPLDPSHEAALGHFRGLPHGSADAVQRAIGEVLAAMKEPPPAQPRELASGTASGTEEDGDSPVVASAARAAAAAEAWRSDLRSLLNYFVALVPMHSTAGEAAEDEEAA